MADDEAPEKPKPEPVKITFDILWNICLDEEQRRWRWIRNFGANTTLEREHTAFIRLANMVRIWEEHETEFAAAIAAKAKKEKRK